MALSALQLSAGSKYAEQALSSHANSHLRKTLDASRTTLIIPLHASGFSIGKRGTLQLDIDDEECGWIATIHAEFKPIENGVKIGNRSANAFTIQRTPIGTPGKIFPSAGKDLLAGTYHMILGQNWSFRLTVWPTPDEEPSSLALTRSIQPACHRHVKFSTISVSQIFTYPDPSIEADQAKSKINSVSKGSPLLNSPVHGREASAQQFDLGHVFEPIYRSKICEVVVKVVRKRLIVEKRCLDSDYADMWAHEANILKSIKHRHIVSLVEFRPSSLPVIETYYAGIDLACIHDQQRMSTLTVEHQECIKQQTLSAIKYLNEQNLIHGDVKLQNILFDKQTAHTTLIDFGMGKHEKPIRPRKICGTAHYLPPEAALGYRKTSADDLWALGIVMLVLHGHLPTNLNYRDVGECLQSWKLTEDEESGFRKHWTWIGVVKKLRKRLPRGSISEQLLAEQPEERLQVLTGQKICTQPVAC